MAYLETYQEILLFAAFRIECRGLIELAQTKITIFTK